MGEGRSRSRVVVIVLSVLVALVLAGALTARLIFTPDRLRQSVVKASESALGLPVQLAGAQLSFVPLGVSLQGLRIAGASPADPPLLALDAGRVRVALPSLLRGRVDVAELRFEHPVISLRRNGSGVILPGKLAAPAPGAGGASGGAGGAPAPPTTIEKLEIVRGTLHLSGPQPPGDVTLEGIDLSARVDLSEGGSRVRTRGELRLAGLSLPALAAYRKTLDALSPKVQFDLDYQGTHGTLDMASVRLHAPPLDIGGHGRLSGLPASPRIELVVEPATLALEQLLPLVPPSLIPEGRHPRAKGNVKVSARVDGPLGNPKRPPSFLADVGVEGAELGMEGYPLGIKDLHGALVVSDSALVFRGLAASLGESNLKVDGRIAGPTAPDSGRVNLSLAAALDLGLVEQAGLLPKGASLAGHVDGSVQMSGRASAPESADLRGTMKLTGGQAVLPTLAKPVKDLRGELAFEGADAVLRDVSGSIGSSSFRGDGRIKNVLAKTPTFFLHGTCPRLDLVELMPPAAGAAAAAKPGTSGAAGSKPLPLIPELPPVTAELQLAVDSLIAPNAALANAALNAHLAGGKAALDARAARAYFGPKQDVTMHDVTGTGQMTSGRLDATFQAPRADAYRMPLTAVDGKVKVEGTQVDVTDVKAACFTGKIGGNALVDMTDPVAPSFKIDSKAQGIQANDFLSTLTPAKDVLHGTLDLASNFSGKGIDPKTIAQSLIANGTVDAHGGQLARGPTTQAIWKALNLGEKESINFKELTAPFSISGGKLITKDLVVASPEAAWKANGSVAFDGTLDYGIELEMGEEMAAQFRKRAGGDVARLLAGSTGKVTLDLRVTGPAQHPVVALDTAKLAQRATENLKARTQQQLEAGTSKLMGKLLPGRGAADSAHADSTKAPAPTLQDALKGLLKKK